MDDAPPRPWHALSIDEVDRRLGGVGIGGLAADDVARRRAVHGPNRIPEPPPSPAWRIFARQLASPMIVVLLVAAGLSLAIGETSDALFIAAVLAANTAIGGTQELRAERSARGLQKLLRFHAVVDRDGEPVEIDAEELVPGDVLRVESGDHVPADARLLAATGLRVDESLLTGESSAVEKDADARPPERAPLADRANMLHAGTTVHAGRGRAIVIGTGGESEVGRLARAVLSGPSGRPPLLQRLDRFSRLVGVASVAAAAAVVGLGIVLQGRDPIEMAIFAIALVVAAIPEGLPVAITVTLAVACRRMARRGAIVRRLDAVEGLGSCSLVATDKTGTLTCNELTVREVRLPGGDAYDVAGEGFVPVGAVTPQAGGDGEGEGDAPGDGIDPAGDPGLSRLVRAAALCNEGSLRERDGGWTWHGDPTDVALLTLAHKLGRSRDVELDALPEVRRVPFEAERRYAASVHAPTASTPGEARLVVVKGAPERVLPMCALAPDDRRSAESEAATMAQHGLRVLAFAEGALEAASDGPPETESDPAGLDFLGLVGMIDPLRPRAADAVRRCRDAGIDVVMVTGDHPDTALAIARELGIAQTPDEVRSGADLPTDPGGLAELLSRTTVFARVAPDQKLAIVRAATGAGRFVAVTGDGVNDAPALRAANIGVAMGRSGTDVARDASDLVLADDEFSTIVAGVEEGRVAYANIRKVTFYLLTTGAIEILIALAAVLAGLPLPLLPAQLLWLNLVTSGVQHVGLAFEPAEGDELERPPRPVRERLLDRRMLVRSIGPVATMSVAGFAVFAEALARGVPVDEARNALLLMMVLFECFHAANCRSESRSILRLSPRRAPILMLGTATALAVHVAAMHVPPVAGVLGAIPVSAGTWLALVAVASTVVVADELYKWYVRRGRPTGASRG